MNADIQGELFNFSTEREESSGILMYQSDATGVKLNVRIEGESVWLTQKQMAELYQTTKRNISSHINNILEEHELEETETSRVILQKRQEGRREVMRSVT
ncbi:MAG: hypothetical protein IJ993_02345, partial [Akkermansia sp.]|nr:hypothetical protein [Akkermansia sp.]